MNCRKLALIVTCFAIVGLATVPGQAAWDITELEGGVAYPYSYISMAVLPGGQPAIAYHINDGPLQYAWLDASTWRYTSVDLCIGYSGEPGSGSGGMMPSLAILPSGQPAISYFGCADLPANNQPLRYAWFDAAANSWQTVVVADDYDCTGNTSLKVLPSGRVAIAFFNDIMDADSRHTVYLKYAEGDAQGTSAWTVSTVDTIGTNKWPDDGLNYNCSMAVLPSGQPAIAYQNDLNDSNEDTTDDNHLLYAAYDGSNWNKSVVDSSGRVGFDCSLAIINEDQPCISYMDFTNNKLGYARYDTATAKWTHTRFTGVSVNPMYSDGTSLARQPSGNPAIVFSHQDDNVQKMRYLRHDGNTWYISTIDTGSWYPSLAFLPNGQPAVAYKTAVLVKYAVKTASDDPSDGDDGDGDNDDGGDDDNGDGSNDGNDVPGPVDECPNDPNKVAPGLCGCGTPDTDSDGDSLPNCLDDCPNDPDKILAGFCGCGNPDTDSDGNGLADCLDTFGISGTPSSAACGTGIVETLMLSTLALFVVQLIRRRR